MDYYVWRAPGKPVQIRVHLPMLRYMAPWIRERDLQPHETFGILLGTIKRRWGRFIVTIDDFEPFDPAKLRGRPKAPPGTDLNVVGLYRRRDGDRLRLDGLDASFIQSSFVHAGMVYLLVAAAEQGPDRAAFFIQEDGEVHGYANYGEFPFDGEFLRGPALDAPRWRRWIPAAGLAASLMALGSWFMWLKREPSPPVAAVSPAATVARPVEAVPPAPAGPKKAAPPPVAKNRERPAKRHRAKRHRPK